ncbi:hypothetical protein [Streptomyces palmae]|uniref:hypothetical protein n=1 Tax=Streptomyces palmae TaxID=1701085 RepID=UPI001AE04A49|nr:hypothetical protein [Streptomyces palmae]
MIDVILPELPERELTLAAEESPPATAPPVPPLTGRLRFGGPLALPVTGGLVDGDPELADFLAQHADAAEHHLVHLTLSCAQDTAGPALHTVNVDLTLTAEHPAAAATAPPVPRAPSGAAPAPVAWSMAPQRLDGGTEHAGGGAGTVRLGPRLSLVDGHAAPRARVCLEALRELRSEPGWEIRRTEDRPIGGTYRLALVVRAPRGALCRVHVEVGASVRNGRQRHRYRQRIPGPLDLGGRLGNAAAAPVVVARVTPSADLRNEHS